MYIKPTDTTIFIYPLIPFPAGNITLVVVHKLTKVQVSLTQSYSSTNSGVTLTLPNLTAINNVATNLDELVVRCFDGTNTLYYEMVNRYVTNSPNILLNRKTWTATNNNTKEWLTL